MSYPQVIHKSTRITDRGLVQVIFQLAATAGMTQLAQSLEEDASFSGANAQSNRRMMKHVKILAYSALAVGLLFLLAVVAAMCLSRKKNLSLKVHQ